MIFWNSAQIVMCVNSLFRDICRILSLGGVKKGKGGPRAKRAKNFFGTPPKRACKHPPVGGCKHVMEYGLQNAVQKGFIIINYNCYQFTESCKKKLQVYNVYCTRTTVSCTCSRYSTTVRVIYEVFSTSGCTQHQ